MPQCAIDPLYEYFHPSILIRSNRKQIPDRDAERRPSTPCVAVSCSLPNMPQISVGPFYEYYEPPISVRCNGKQISDWDSERFPRAPSNVWRSLPPMP